jgi:hypothetical protein
MRSTPSTLPRPLPAALLLSLVAGAALIWATPVAAQTAPAAPAPAEQVPLPASEGKAMERITHEDALSRIDELRVGGETRAIAVQPKNGAPAYEITPLPAADSATSAGQGGSSGRSRWRVLSF